jgi:uncharacterized membrane protein YhaH (DUF805 family)
VFFNALQVFFPKNILEVRRLEAVGRSASTGYYLTALTVMLGYKKATNKNFFKPVKW